MFFTVFVVIFDFEGAVPGFYQVNLSQFSSLRMTDHVFWKFLSLSLIFTLEYLGVPGSTWEYFCYSVFFSVECLGVLGRTWEYHLSITPADLIHKVYKKFTLVCTLP